MTREMIGSIRAGSGDACECACSNPHEPKVLGTARSVNAWLRRKRFYAAPPSHTLHHTHREP